MRERYGLNAGQPQRKRARPEERALSQTYVRDGEFDFLAFGE